MSEIIEYHDERTGVRGWLAYDGSTRPLAAGGCRAQSGVDSAQLAVLAQCMTLKQRILGVNVDGAKCGIDINPASPDKPAVLGGFLAFLRDELRTRFSMGPDMGTDWQELQGHARCVGLPSVKYAIRVAQGMDDAAFAQRMALLDQRCGQLPFSQLRAGHALGHAALAAARIVGVPGRPSVSLQGFGNLARGAANDLAGVRRDWLANVVGKVLPTVLLTHALLPMLRRPDGRVVSISSVAALRGPASYGGAKAALHTWSVELAARLAPDRITVNVVAPGYVTDTDFYGERMSPDFHRGRADRSPMKRGARPDEIASAVEWLAGPHAGFITGQVLHINGGTQLTGR